MFIVIVAFYLFYLYCGVLFDDIDISYNVSGSVNGGNTFMSHEVGTPKWRDHERDD